MEICFNIVILQAGCSEWAIKIALEPEAASIYCQKQPNANFKELLDKKNTKYVVVDLGGTFYFTITRSYSFLLFFPSRLFI